MWDAMLTCPLCTGNRGERFKASPSIPPPRSESLVISPDKSCGGFGRHTVRDAPPEHEGPRGCRAVTDLMLSVGETPVESMVPKRRTVLLPGGGLVEGSC